MFSPSRLPPRRRDTPRLLPLGFGDAIAGLPPAQQALFAEGREEFKSVENASEGLGPVFNGTSCGGCHASPAVGGVNDLVETRFGRTLNGKFDPMTEFGGSLIQTDGIGTMAECEYLGEKVPAEATIVAGRVTTPLFGLGLVDAVPDSTFRAIALAERVLTPSTAGRAQSVVDPVGPPAVGKFGEGAGAEPPAVLRDAYLNEMGITSPMFSTRTVPRATATCSSACPRRGSRRGRRTSRVRKLHAFLASAGPSPTTSAAASRLLRDRVSPATRRPRHGRASGRRAEQGDVLPFSDFLLHDMGALGDGI